MNKIKKTKQASQILQMIDQFVNNYQRAKKRSCDVVHLKKDQFEALGVQQGYNYLGVRLEMYQ